MKLLKTKTLFQTNIIAIIYLSYCILKETNRQALFKATINKNKTKNQTKKQQQTLYINKYVL